LFGSARCTPEPVPFAGMPPLRPRPDSSHVCRRSWGRMAGSPAFSRSEGSLLEVAGVQGPTPLRGEGEAVVLVKGAHAVHLLQLGRETRSHQGRAGRRVSGAAGDARGDIGDPLGTTALRLSIGFGHIRDGELSRVWDLSCNHCVLTCICAYRRRKASGVMPSWRLKSRRKYPTSLKPQARLISSTLRPLSISILRA
jgi:hypothetical protein